MSELPNHASPQVDAQAELLIAVVERLTAQRDNWYRAWQDMQRTASKLVEEKRQLAAALASLQAGPKPEDAA